MTKIVWNGCDGYMSADDALRHGYKFDGDKLYTARGEFSSFDAELLTPEEENRLMNSGDLLPRDIFLTETGRFYRATR